MASREKWEESVEAWAWVFRLLQVLEGTTTKTKATSSTTTTTSKQNRASCTGHQEAASAVPAPESEMAILVLQNSLRSALHRAAAAGN